jgi:hypothetical protein
MAAKQLADERFQPDGCHRRHTHREAVEDHRQARVERREHRTGERRELKAADPRHGVVH